MVDSNKAADRLAVAAAAAHNRTAEVDNLEVEDTSMVVAGLCSPCPEKKRYKNSVKLDHEIS